MFQFLFLFFSMLLMTMRVFQIKRIISSEKWFYYVVTFFFENDKNLGRSDDAKRRKKEVWPKREIYIFYSQTNFSLYMVHSSLLISYFEKLSTCL